jgi:hypothetical protein
MAATTPVLRRFGPADLLDWFENAPPLGLRGLGLAAQIRM